MIGNKEIVIELTENFYEELVIKSIEPNVDLEKLQYHTIVRNKKGAYGVLWVKKVFKKDDKFFANVRVQTTVATYEEAVAIMDELKSELKDKGIQTKSN